MIGDGPLTCKGGNTDGINPAACSGPVPAPLIYGARMITHVHRVLLAALLTTALAACSTGTPVPAATAGPDPAADRAAVQTAFTGYNQALLRHDFPGACAALTDKVAGGVVAQAKAKGMQVQSCEQAFAAIYAMPAAAQALDQASRTIEISTVAITGDTATISYSASRSGTRTPPLTIQANRVAGVWRIGDST